jgi:hypothetical protein
MRPYMSTTHEEVIESVPCVPLVRAGGGCGVGALAGGTKVGAMGAGAGG